MTRISVSNAGVTVRAPGRLHLGFLDPAGALGRRFGSVGLVLDGFTTEVEVSAAVVDRITLSGVTGGSDVEGSDGASIAAPARGAEAQIARAAAHLQQLRARTGCDQPLHLQLLRALPPHAGFGSGTQLALAVGHAFAHWHRLALDTPTLAHWLGRGLRSGIGVHGFDHGGLLVDGGPGADGRPAPLVSRIALPAAWRVVVVEDERASGIAGEAEKAALAALAPMPRHDAAAICHEVLMRVLPGAASAEFDTFARGVSAIQQRLGEHYAPAQNGGAYTSPAVGRLLRWAAIDGTPEAAIGQSSWGPTGFAIVPSAARAEALVAGAGAAGVAEPGLRLRVVRARDRGAEIIDTRRRFPVV